MILLPKINISFRYDFSEMPNYRKQANNNANNVKSDPASKNTILKELLKFYTLLIFSAEIIPNTRKLSPQSFINSSKRYN